LTQAFITLLPEDSPKVIVVKKKKKKAEIQRTDGMGEGCSNKMLAVNI